MRQRKQLEDDWELCARDDPWQAIANYPGRGKNDENPWSREDFFAVGEIELSHFLTHWQYRPTGSDSVLDIGCGLGRLSRPLAKHFGEVHGVDISQTMIAEARKLNADVPNLHFHHGSGNDLKGFEDRSFDAVFSYIVFQHLPDEIVLNYLSEIARVLRPGGQAFVHIPYGRSHERFSFRRSVRRRLHLFVRRWGGARLALRIWNPVVTRDLDRAMVTERAASVGLSMETRDVPPIVIENAAHADGIFTLFSK